MLNASHDEVTYLKDILPATYGIVFMGTPHRGSVAASMGKIAYDLTKAVWNNPNTGVLQDLERNSQTLDRVGKKFSQVLARRVKEDKPLNFHTFIESIPMKGVMIVPKDSATILSADEVVGSIPANHRNMAKFASATDVGYIRVSAVIARWVRNIKDKAAENTAVSGNKSIQLLYLRQSLRSVRRAQTYLHREPWTVMDEEIFTDKSRNNTEMWVKGIYHLPFPADNPIAHVYLSCDWHAFENDPSTPVITWRITTPKSLYYPGTRYGKISLRDIHATFKDRNFVAEWLSPIFAPHISLFGRVSSDGDLEELCIYNANLTPLLQSFAHLTAYGPFHTPGIPRPPYTFHELIGSDAGVVDYFSRYDRGRFARASSFFARAYTVSPPLPEDFVGVGFSDQCRETTVTVIGELLEAYDTDRLATTGPEWNYVDALKTVNSQSEWAREERRWADKLVPVCGLRFIARALASPEMADL